MEPEKQRIAIAEACGWKHIRVFTYRGERFVAGFPPGKEERKQAYESQSDPEVPDYLNDLNAMNEAERSLNQWRMVDYVPALASVILSHAGLPADGYCGRYPLLTATAAQRAEAFLKTLNLWID